MSTSREVVVQRGIGGLVFALFGAWWLMVAFIAIRATSLYINVLTLVLELLVVPLILVVLSLLLIRSASGLPNRVNDQDSAGRKHGNRRFWIVNIVQMATILIAIIVGMVIKRPELIPPVIAIIVGLHFFALIPVFHLQVDVVIGSILCGVGIISGVVLAMTSANSTKVMLVLVVCLASACILWAGSVSRLIIGRRALIQTGS